MSTNAIPPWSQEDPDDNFAAGALSARQVAMYNAIDSVEDLLGNFDQDAGPDGAHYFPASPWANQGIKCANCVAFMGVAHACHWVDGDIDPNGICKLWIIPQNLIDPEMTTGRPTAPDMNQGGN
jgi:hypothetical protein